MCFVPRMRDAVLNEYSFQDFNKYITQKKKKNRSKIFTASERHSIRGNENAYQKTHSAR